ncbi:MAG: hypothetical protein ACKOUM_03600, partial [Sphingopyxis sp.]
MPSIKTFKSLFYSAIIACPAVFYTIHTPATATEMQQAPSPLLNVTRGGAGGRIIRVTSLAASGPGTLRAALDATGPRIILFDVGGVIDLGRLALALTQPDVAIAG